MMPLMTYKQPDTAQARMVACLGWCMGRALPDRGVPDFCTQAAPAPRDPLPIAHARHPHHCAVPRPVLMRAAPIGGGRGATLPGRFCTVRHGRRATPSRRGPPASGRAAASRNRDAR
jgi:hypothetical protein